MMSTEDRTTVDVSKIESYSSPFALIEHDPTATAQPAICNQMLCIDLRDGEVFIESRTEFGRNSTPGNVWHGVERRYPISHAADAEWLAKDLCDKTSDIRQLLQRILDGAIVRWDGSNFVGELDDDSEVASERLYEILQTLNDLQFGIFMAGDWFNLSDPDEVTAESTDKELDELASKYESDARSDDAFVFGIRDFLEEYRDRLREAIADA